MEFSTRLAQQMQAQNITSDELAVKMSEIGCSVQGQTVRLWLKGRNLPRADYLPVLTRVLRCHLEDLIPLPRAKAAS